MMKAGDLISRGAVLEIMGKTLVPRSTTYGMGMIAGLTAAKDALRSAPAVDAVDVKHGRWVRDNNNMVVCLLCGAEPLLDDYGFWVKSNYCPNCGARMDGE